MNPPGAGGRQGLMLVDKPRGLTSHDVVARLRRLAGQKKIGHTGTLDPLATGLLAVLMGAATRLEPYLSRMNKTYLARVELGLVTDTDDADGRVLGRHPGPWPAEEEVRRALRVGEGEGDQVPPAFSAIKVAGRRAYRAARAGSPLDLAPRRVTAFRLELLGYEPPHLDLIAEVSAGYYIRALARDLGLNLGLGGGALTALRRERVGPWSVEQARTLEEMAGWTEEEWQGHLRPPAEALPHWPELVLADQRAARFTQGRPVGTADEPGRYKISDARGRFLGLGQIDAVATGGETAPRGPFLRPLRVFPAL
ncbi:MAG: tRNA pseudouridine(55) synthase TruB [Candidatus Adiutrix sp.]|jgi:tRNA pseudouridine55 synthase|nr:tRNA pseudouridine(55) synthase TruB [Candidatus Adiutrix sp.]